MKDQDVAPAAHQERTEPPDAGLADDYCIVCGELLARHYSPCRAVGDANGVLRLLERLVGDGKRAAAIRVLDRHLRERPDDGRKLVQSEGAPARAAEWQPISTAPADADVNPVLLFWPYWSQEPVIGNLCNGIWWTEKWLGEDATDPGPTHWMPLPLPPGALAGAVNE